MKNAAAVKARVNLGAFRRNYRDAVARLGQGVTLSAVLKADGYGLGAVKLAEVLTEEGCRDFFVARLTEAMKLRDGLRNSADPYIRSMADKVAIYVLDGVPPGSDVADLIDFKVIPVLNDVAQVERWNEAGRARGESLPAILQFESGMNRIGMATDPGTVAGVKKHLDNVNVLYVMTHLAKAGEVSTAPDGGHAAGETTESQLKRFDQVHKEFPDAKASLGASSVIRLDKKFHKDMVRAGGYFHGQAPLAVDVPDPLKNVLTLETEIHAVKEVERGGGIGYGHRYTAPKDMKTAVIPFGYADGPPRKVVGNDAGEGQRPYVLINGEKAYFLAATSMDMGTYDVTDMKVKAGDKVLLIGDKLTPDEFGEMYGTNASETQTKLTSRVERIYEDDPSLAKAERNNHPSPNAWMPLPATPAAPEKALLPSSSRAGGSYAAASSHSLTPYSSWRPTRGDVERVRRDFLAEMGSSSAAREGWESLAPAAAGSQSQPTYEQELMVTNFVAGGPAPGGDLDLAAASWRPATPRSGASTAPTTPFERSGGLLANTLHQLSRIAANEDFTSTGGKILASVGNVAARNFLSVLLPTAARQFISYGTELAFQRMGASDAVKATIATLPPMAAAVALLVGGVRDNVAGTQTPTSIRSRAIMGGTTAVAGAAMLATGRAAGAASTLVAFMIYTALRDLLVQSRLRLINPNTTGQVPDAKHFALISLAYGIDQALVNHAMGALFSPSGAGAAAAGSGVEPGNAFGRAVINWVGEIIEDVTFQGIFALRSIGGTESHALQLSIKDVGYQQNNVVNGMLGPWAVRTGILATAIGLLSIMTPFLAGNPRLLVLAENLVIGLLNAILYEPFANAGSAQPQAGFGSRPGAFIPPDASQIEFGRTYRHPDMDNTSTASRVVRVSPPSISDAGSRHGTRLPTLSETLSRRASQASRTTPEVEVRTEDV